MYQKKQFKLYDVYRKATLNTQSAIKGINNYEVEVNNAFKQIQISITFNDYETYEDLFTIGVNTEEKLKEFIKRVNKKLKKLQKT